jgi:hypothetical protein
MPLIHKLEPGLWEVRSRIADGIADVLFTVDEQSELPRRMKTSRSAVERRLLDPANTAVTLSTLERAASAMGKRLKVQLTS